MATLTLVPDQVTGATAADVHLAHVLTLTPDNVNGQTRLYQITAQQAIWLQFDPITGGSTSVLKDFPDLGNNVPIYLALSAKTRLEATDLEVSE